MIVQTSGTCNGEPRIDGHRITVKNIIQYLAGEMTIQEICEDFGLEKEQVIAAIRWVIDDLDKRF